MGTRFLILFLITMGLGIICGCGNREPTTTQPVQPEQSVSAASLPDHEEGPEGTFSQQPDKKAPQVDKVADVNDSPQDQGAKAVSFNENLADFFSCYINSDGMVNYKKLRPKRLELIQVLREFDQLAPKEYDSWPKTEKIAFWINAYNLCTIKVIIDNYPIQASRYMILFYPANSIRQISKPWTKYDFSIMQVKYTLREIDRRILSRQFDEPRVCFALSYASLDGPRLRNEPYTGRKLEQQLDEQVRSFIDNKRGFNIDTEKGEVYLSAIFKWYANILARRFGTDRKFTDKKPEIRTALNFISNYVSRAKVDFLERKAYSVEYIKFDWTLNE
jgi:hypothetical protein